MKGVLDIEQGVIQYVLSVEKDAANATLISGGFIVMNQRYLIISKGDDTVFEREPLQRLAAERDS